MTQVPAHENSSSADDEEFDEEEVEENENENESDESQSRPKRSMIQPQQPQLIQTTFYLAEGQRNEKIVLGSDLSVTLWTCENDGNKTTSSTTAPAEDTSTIAKRGTWISSQCISSSNGSCTSNKNKWTTCVGIRWSGESKNTHVYVSENGLLVLDRNSYLANDV